MPKRRRRRLKLIPTIIAAIIFIILIGGIITAGWVFSIAANMPDITVEDMMPDQTSTLYDADGKVYTIVNRGENRTSISLDDMPPYLKDALIATEDARFYSHNGIDIKRIFGAAVKDVFSGSYTQGASTITMQLARNAILEDQSKKMTRKVKEALLALQIEKNYSKDEILNFYINEIYIGQGNTYGLQAGAKLYFNKDVKDLSIGEAAMLVGVIRGPKVYSPFNNLEKATQRRNVVLNNLIKYYPDYTKKAEAAKEEELVIHEGHEDSVSSYDFPWFTDYVIDQAEDILTESGIDSAQIYMGGLQIYTTVDPDVQEAMENVYANSSYFPPSNTADLIQSAMVVTDPSTGQIRGIIGGREYTTKRGFNRGVALERQPGSTIKPVAVYGAALEAGYSPASVVNDVPTSFGTYKPSNYDGRWRGIISMREAIMYSVNMPAVKFLQKIGVDQGLAFAQNLGLPLDSANDKNLALALGGISEGVSPLEMAGAYGAFANEGVYIKPYCIIRIEDKEGNILYEANPQKKIAMSEETAYLMTSMLQSVTQAGTGTNAQMNRPVASKTGTTQLPDKPEFAGKKGNKDAWFAAYTPELCGVVWMGYDNEKDANGNVQYLNQIYGGKYPAGVWKKVMTQALKNVAVKQFTKPANITTVAIDKKSGLLPSSITPSDYIKTEAFNTANVPTQISDVWISVKICPDSGKLATEYCPNPVTKAKLKRTGDISPKAEDYSLYAPSASCTIHTSASSNMVKVSVCTDPRHDGHLYLANIAGEGQSGGCPSEYVETRYFAKETEPTEHCDLPDHAIAGNSGGGKDKDNTPLSTPTDLSVSFNQAGKSIFCSVSWSDNYNDPHSTLYVLERITDGDSSTRVKFSTYGHSYRDNDIETGHIYRYRVYAYDESSENLSDWSSAASIST